MKTTLLKIKVWLTQQAEKNEQEAKTCRFESLNAAYRADAKNYRAIVKEIDAALAKREATT
jgi:predicted lipase